jgi:hypothetical protein
LAPDHSNAPKSSIKAATASGSSCREIGVDGAKSGQGDASDGAGDEYAASIGADTDGQRSSLGKLVTMNEANVVDDRCPPATFR